MEGYRQFFGLMHVSGSIPEKTREKVMETAKAIYGRHYAEAKKELGQVLGPMGLEIVMGMLVEKEAQDEGV